MSFYARNESKDSVPPATEPRHMIAYVCIIFVVAAVLTCVVPLYSALEGLLAHKQINGIPA